MLHDPGPTRSADIVFVHGLGGSCQLSWCYNKDLDLFWPKEWLSAEPEIQDARILTFGYNAHFMSRRGEILNMSDFAQDLLMQMRFGSGADGRSLEMGQVREFNAIRSPSSYYFMQVVM